jgi:hypothetical protein
VLRTLEDLERVLWVVNEVLVFRPFPLRIPHIQAEVLHHPAFEFSTSVNSVELNLLVGSSPPFDFQIKNLFAEVLYSVVVTKILTPPTTIPSPEPSPGPIIIIPSPSPPPPPGGEGGGSGGNGTGGEGGRDGSRVTWHVKVHARSEYREEPGTGVILILLQIFFGVTKTNQMTGEVLHHTEVLEYPGYQVSELTLIPIGVTYSAEVFSKRWRIILPGLEDTFELSVPPFNRLEPPEANVDEQVHEYTEG